MKYGGFIFGADEEHQKKQRKGIRALAKADARPVKQMLSMVLNEGFNWVFNDFQENIQPYQGWPDDWEKIKKELEQEYKKAMEVK